MGRWGDEKGRGREERRSDGAGREARRGVWGEGRREEGFRREMLFGGGGEGGAEDV